MFFFFAASSAAALNGPLGTSQQRQQGLELQLRCLGWSGKKESSSWSTNSKKLQQSF